MKKILAALLSLCFLLAPLAAQADLADNLAAYWRLDDNTGTSVSDASGNGYTGTFGYNLGANPVWATGKVNYGVAFNGATYQGGNQISMGYVSPISGNSFSISAWVYYVGNGAGGNYNLCGIIGMFDNTGLNRDAYTLEIINTPSGSYGGKIVFSMLGGTISNSYSYSVSTVSTGAWHYIVVTYDGSNVKIYLDGSLNSTTATTGNIQATGVVPLYIGRTSGWFNSSGTFNGTIDEVGMWSRPLSSTEVTALYNGGAGTYLVIPPPPVRTMRLFEGYKIRITSGTIKISSR